MIFFAIWKLKTSKTYNKNHEKLHHFINLHLAFVIRNENFIWSACCENRFPQHFNSYPYKGLTRTLYSSVLRKTGETYF